MTTDAAVASERRAFPRRSFESPLLLTPAPGGAVISCATVDLSVGGARVTATEAIPLGSCDVTVDADNGWVSVAAEVREAILDVETGLVTARVQFLGVPARERERLADLMGTERAAVVEKRRHPWRVALVVAGVAVAGVLVAIAAARPTSPGVMRTERADSALRIVVTDDPKETVALSAAEQSVAGDPVQVHLDAGAAQGAGQIPVVVTVENNGSKKLSFGNGLRATVQARRDGAPVTELVLTSELQELAPGERTSVRGIIQLGRPGAYDLDVSVRVAS